MLFPSFLAKTFAPLGGIAVAAMLGAAPGAQAQNAYPSKPIRVVVPFPAGTAPDVMARFWGERLSQQVRQPVVIENRAGAATIVGTQAVAAAPADGYTLLYTASGTVTINPYAYKKLPYQPADLVPLTRMLTIPLVVSVPESSAYKTLADLIKDAQAHPKRINFASYGVGTVPHLSMAYFANSAGIALNHVPYRDGGMTDLVGGTVDVAFSPSADVLQFIKTRKIRPLAVSSSKRLESLPQVPTVAESFPGFEGDSWHGVFALKGTPQPVLDLIATTSRKIAESDEYRKQLRELGMVPAGGSPEQFAALIAAEGQRWARVVKDNQITLD
ncbi:tripartite tricarboxylate transporter substrate binding protein [Variovorax sp. SG517]|uniref:Bug family tripartite tricarboxylate transporter substrate binding protein n=1 Tax=unclassified Variovorax TaxID=663243 RepID=UPI00159E455C|nr:tripartite tricarboxylate transporter substrate binding protein [Variovorax sp. SG517]NVM91937.1 tripartite-type tricarboxylate transporter receptor subunit TctC [Variovorax sp. SG517]